MLAVDASLVVELSLDRIGEQAGVDLARGDQLIAPLLWGEVRNRDLLGQEMGQGAHGFQLIPT